METKNRTFTISITEAKYSGLEFENLTTEQAKIIFELFTEKGISFDLLSEETLVK